MVARGCGVTKSGDLYTTVVIMVLWRIQGPCCQISEPSIGGYAREPGVMGFFSEQSDGGAVLREGFTEGAHDLGGSVGHGVEDSHQPWADVVA